MRGVWALLAASVPVMAMFAANAAAGATVPVAIVEEIDGGDMAPPAMALLPEGTVLALGASGRAVLGYFSSCVQETIVGGTVIVGTDQSRVSGGRVDRGLVECGGTAMILADDQTGKSGVGVFRASPGAKALPAPRGTIYARRPIFVLSGPGGPVELERLDRPSDAVRLAAGGRVLDLATLPGAMDLSPGGLYRVRHGGRETVFEIDAFARPGGGPAVGRVVVF